MELTEAKAVFKAGRWREAAPLLAEVAAATASAGDAHHADALFWLARVRWELNERAASEQAHRAALELRQRLLPPDHPDLVISLLMVGMIHVHAGRLADAEPLLTESASAARARGLDRDDAPLAHALCCLGHLRARQKRIEEAAALWEEAIRVAGIAAGEETPPSALARISLGERRMEQRAWGEALALFRDALGIVQLALGSTHRLVAWPWRCIALAHEKAGDRADAEAAWLRAVEIEEQAPPPDPPQLAFTLQRLAFVYGSDVAHVRARERFLRRALAVRLRTAPLDDESVRHLIAKQLLEVYWVDRSDRACHALLVAGRVGRMLQRKPKASAREVQVRLVIDAVSHPIAFARVVRRFAALWPVIEAGRRLVADGSAEEAETVFRAFERACPPGRVGDELRDWVRVAASTSWRARHDDARANAWRSSPSRPAGR